MLARGGAAPCAPSRAACSRRHRCAATAHAAPHSDDAAALPVVDLTPLSGGNAAARAVAAAALRRALHLHGFAYVRGAGVPSAPCCDAALSAASAFFALPDAEKHALHYGRSPAFRGYAQLGAENTAGAPDHREQLEIGEEQAAPPPGTLPPFLRLRGPNQWPRPGACDALRPALTALAEQLCGLSEALLAALGESLLGGDAGGELRAALGAAPDWTLKAARYPPRDGPDAGLGVGAHSDSGVLTLLLQPAGVRGLQVLRPDGATWADVPPLPGTLVLNAGEALQLATGGYLRAAIHRVVPPPPGGPARVSLPYFFNSDHAAVIAPLQSSILQALPWERPGERFLPGTHGGRNVLLPRAGDNVFKSFARSHPAAFAANHADLRIMPDGTVAPR